MNGRETNAHQDQYLWAFSLVPTVVKIKIAIAGRKKI
jgi:hypothetical protein